MITVANLKGIDVSRWEDNNATPQKMDFTKAKAAGARFVFIKLGQGNWIDEDFSYNWIQAKQAGIPRGAFWFLDNRYDPLAQAQMFMRKLAATGDPGEIPPVCDFEHRLTPPTPAQARLRLKTFLAYVEQTDKRVPIIYTGPAYWAEFGSFDPLWKRFPLWIAHYSTTTPTVPIPWTSWAFWQYTAQGDGIKYGAESAGIDMDYYQPGQGFDYVFEAPPPTPLPLTQAQKVAILWEAHPELHPESEE